MSDTVRKEEKMMNITVNGFHVTVRNHGYIPKEAERNISKFLDDVKKKKQKLPYAK